MLLQSLGNSQREYEKHVLLYSIRNQLRFRNNLGEMPVLTTPLPFPKQPFTCQFAAHHLLSFCFLLPLSSATCEEGRAQVLRGAAEVQPGTPNAVPLPPI